MKLMRTEKRSKMKSVLITGGSRGIGAAMVRAFTESGYKVAFLYKERDDKAKGVSEETGAVGICCDVSDSQQVSEGVRAARMYLEVPYFDVLICNAGISITGLFTDTTQKQWKEIMDTNLYGTISVTSQILPTMIERQQGSIVMISSVWGQTGGSCEVAYSTTKAAVIGFAKSLAKEVAPSGVRVNCIAPGVIDTDMSRICGEDTLQALTEEIPMGKIGDADEVAKAAVFLASEEASYITGQILAVNGGFYI
ncbi:elongation factor P 5-aminopentanone reductase [Anaerotruncus colihominis]|nr:3-oxoacyl-ACP reductase FabG [Anaerotruncus colihominis]